MRRPKRDIPTDRTITYSRQYRHCGKRVCRCHTGRGHGPYWYAYWREGGRTLSAYVGKVPPADLHPRWPVERSA